MTNSQGMKNSMINASASFAAGLVVDAANAHRSYLPGVERPCVSDRVVLRPDLGSPCSASQPRSTLTPIRVRCVTRPRVEDADGAENLRLCVHASRVVGG